MQPAQMVTYLLNCVHIAFASSFMQVSRVVATAGTGSVAGPSYAEDVEQFERCTNNSHQLSASEPAPSTPTNSKQDRSVSLS